MKFTTQLTDTPWFVYLRFPFNEPVKNYVKQIPGVSWEKDRKAWKVPIEVVELIEKEFP